VEERWRAAYYILGCQEHAVANGVAVVKYAAVSETGGFGHAGCAGSELDIDDVVGVKGFDVLAFEQWSSLAAIFEDIAEWCGAS